MRLLTGVVGAAALALLLVPLAAGDFGRPAEIPVAPQPVAVAISDTNQDGWADLITASASGPNITVLSGRGDGSFPARRKYAAGPGSGTRVRALRPADLDGDGVEDLAVADGDGISILAGTGTGFRRLGRYALEAPASLAADDVDADGDLDLVATSSARAAVSVLFGAGDGSFERSVEYPIAEASSSVAIADLDGDDDFDLAAANSRTRTVSLLLGSGDGTFERFRETGVAPVQPGPIAAGDLDGDDDADLSLGSPSGNRIAVLLNAGDGTFDDSSAHEVGRAPVALSLTDMDGDGALDIVAANRGSNDVSILLAQGDGTFSAQDRAGVGKSPVALAAGDVNDDGGFDLAVANEGSNSVSVLLEGLDAPRPAVCLVPRVVGKRLAVARRLVTRARCAVAKLRWRYSNRVGKWRVLAQNPAAGTRLPVRTPVTLLVSRGPRR